MEMNNHDKYYNELYKCSFEKLIELAEMPDDEKNIINCDSALNAMSKIFKLGSCTDVATGLKYYINFLQSKNEIVENT